MSQHHWHGGEREGALGLFADRVRSHWAAPVARAFEAAHIHLRRMLKPNDLQLGGEERLSLFARKIRVHLAPDATPLQEYLAEKPASDRLIWRAYSKFFDILAPAPWSEMPSLLRSESELEHYWESFYRAADQLSRDYGARYRSSYVLIAILAVVGLAMAAIAGEATSGINHFVLAVEVLAWIGIGFVVVANLLFRWHERWLSYRLIAELCRKQRNVSTTMRQPVC